MVCEECEEDYVFDGNGDCSRCWDVYPGCAQCLDDGSACDVCQEPYYFIDTGLCVSCVTEYGDGCLTCDDNECLEA